MLFNMLSHFSHGFANSLVVVQNAAVLGGVPVRADELGPGPLGAPPHPGSLLRARCCSHRINGCKGVLVTHPCGPVTGTVRGMLDWAEKAPVDSVAESSWRFGDV